MFIIFVTPHISIIPAVGYITIFDISRSEIKRNKVKEKIFVIDAFAEAALEFSQDTESAKVGGKSTDNFTF